MDLITFRQDVVNFDALHNVMMVIAGASGYNGAPGSVGGSTYATQSYDPYSQNQHSYGQPQHAYGNSAMQPQAPSSPYGRQGGANGGFSGGGFGSAMGAPNPYASSAAPVPARSPVRHWTHSPSQWQLHSYPGACGLQKSFIHSVIAGPHSPVVLCVHSLCGFTFRTCKSGQLPKDAAWLMPVITYVGIVFNSHRETT